MNKEENIEKINREIEIQLLDEMEKRKIGIKVVGDKKSRKKRIKYKLMLMAPLLIILILKLMFFIVAQIN